MGFARLTATPRRGRSIFRYPDIGRHPAPPRVFLLQSTSSPSGCTRSRPSFLASSLYSPLSVPSVCPHRPPPFSPTKRLAVSPSPTCRRFLSRTPNPAPTVFPRLSDSCSCSLFRVRSLAGPRISSSVSFPILLLASLVKCSTKRGFCLHRYRTALDPCLYSLDLGDFANGPRFQHFDIAAKRIYHGGGFNTSRRNNFHLLRLPRRNSGFRETRTFLRDIHSRRGLVRSEYETTRWREHIKAAKTLPKRD